MSMKLTYAKEGYGEWWNAVYGGYAAEWFYGIYSLKYPRRLVKDRFSFGCI